MSLISKHHLLQQTNEKNKHNNNEITTLYFILISKEQKQTANSCEGYTQSSLSLLLGSSPLASRQ